MRLATFNIYWLGDPHKAPRTPEHHARISHVLASLDADLLVLQEIVDVEVLRAILARAGPREWCFEDGDTPVASVGSPQRVVIAWDAARVTLEGWERVHGAKGKTPVVARVRVGGHSFAVVGLHLQAGYPVFTDALDSAARRIQCENLVGWLAGASGPLVVAGDFNAPRTSSEPSHAAVVESLAPLHSLAGWTWTDAREDERGGGRVTSWTDSLLLDHVMLSPGLLATTPPTIVAFDLDGADHLVSDHRPVVVDVTPSPGRADPPRGG